MTPLQLGVHILSQEKPDARKFLYMLQLFNGITHLLTKEYRADFRFKNKNNQNLLMIASAGKYTPPAVIQYLIERQKKWYSVDQKDKAGETAIQTAIRVGSHSTVRVLHEAGAKMETRVRGGTVRAAIMNNHPKVLDYLIQNNKISFTINYYLMIIKFFNLLAIIN